MFCNQCDNPSVVVRILWPVWRPEWPALLKGSFITGFATALSPFPQLVLTWGTKGGFRDFQCSGGCQLESGQEKSGIYRVSAGGPQYPDGYVLGNDQVKSEAGWERCSVLRRRHTVPMER